MLVAALAKDLDANVAGLVFDPVGTAGNVFTSLMPDQPDAAVMIKGTGGFEQASKLPHDLPTVEFLVRGDPHDLASAADVAQAIYDRYQAHGGVLLDEGGVDEVWVVGMTAMQSAPVDLGQDGNQRFEFSLNFRIHTHHPTLNRS